MATDDLTSRDLDAIEAEPHRTMYSDMRLLVREVRRRRSENERLRTALEGTTSALYATVGWLEDDPDDTCDAGNPDGGSPKTCAHCIVRDLIRGGNAALKAAEAALSSERPS